MLMLWTPYVMLCHVTSPSSLSDSWLHEWTSAAQFLGSRTVFIRSVPVSPVHIRILSIQDILGLPRPRFPSTGPVIKFSSILPNGCLIMCAKYHNFRWQTCCSSTLLASVTSCKRTLVIIFVKEISSSSDALVLKCLLLGCVFPPPSSTSTLRSHTCTLLLATLVPQSDIL